MNILKKILKKNRIANKDKISYPSFVIRAVAICQWLFCISLVIMFVIGGFIGYDYFYPNNPYHNYVNTFSCISIVFLLIAWIAEAKLPKYLEYRYRKIGEIHPAISNAVRATLDRKNQLRIDGESPGTLRSAPGLRMSRRVQRSRRGIVEVAVGTS